MSQTQIFIALGSNLGDRIENLDRARNLIEKEIGIIVSASSLYSSKAVGFKSEHDFINQVIEIRSKLSPESILDKTQDIEKIIGRSKKSTDKMYIDRLIDIDLLLYGSLKLETENLTIPHKEMLFRDFVLVPLIEIAPNVVHPVTLLQLHEINNSLQISSTLKII